MEGGPPIFGQDSSCPALLEDRNRAYPYGAVTRSGAPFQTLPVRANRGHWPGPRSLAATGGVSVDFLSSGY